MALKGKPGDCFVIGRAEVGGLIERLADGGYTVVGPAVRDGAIVYDSIESDADLPEGWTDEQEAGTYRLKRREDKALFGYNVGPHSWKKYFFPPHAKLWEARKEGETFRVRTPEEEVPSYALLGVRACEIHAIRIQDKVFVEGKHVDPIYRKRRTGAFIVAVNCGQAASTCFCVSMETGPKAEDGFDLAMTEILDGERHEFVVEIGTERGGEILSALERRPANEADLAAARGETEKAASEMGRKMDTSDIKDLLYRNLEHPRWEEVAGRCLACTNCTLVCPTCFCSTVEDVSDLKGEKVERTRSWDSCFTMDHSYVHGGSVRSSIKSRYRQWLTHKLGTWIDQFGTSGCVGCGRCIAWCPVGIDITEEVWAIRKTEKNDGGKND